MDSAEQVILVLELILTIGPVAVYFLTLGLASSQAHPYLVSERADFVLLALAFVPVITWPVVALLEAGRLGIALLLLSAVIVLFFGLLPRRHSGWVVYNISDQECRRALRRACRRIGWGGHEALNVREAAELTIPQAGLNVSLHSMPWLRNVTIRCQASPEAQAGCLHHNHRDAPAGCLPDHRPASADQDLARRALQEALAHELRRESLLPSPIGAGLVVIGATMLGLPMWYFFHNMDAIVDVVRRMILA